MTDITTLDRRTNAFRPDLAEASLRPFVKADRYSEPVMRHCIAGLSPLLAEPNILARQVSEIRYGEFLDVIEDRADGFFWVQTRFDRYVGYIRKHAQILGQEKPVLSDEIGDLSNRLKVLQSFIYTEPHTKSRICDRLTLGSYLRVVREESGFFELASGGYVVASHVASSDEAGDADIAFTAGRLLNVPFVIGGRTSLGVDSAGLLQLALDMAGLEAPRDVDQQRAFLGHDLPVHWRDVAWRRGDIVFFPTHVGIMTDDAHVISANESTMCVTVCPLVHLVELYGNIVAMAHPRVP